MKGLDVVWNNFLSYFEIPVAVSNEFCHSFEGLDEVWNNILPYYEIWCSLRYILSQLEGHDALSVVWNNFLSHKWLAQLDVPEAFSKNFTN